MGSVTLYNATKDQWYSGELTTINAAFGVIASPSTEGWSSGDTYSITCADDYEGETVTVDGKNYNASVIFNGGNVNFNGGCDYLLAKGTITLTESTPASVSASEIIAEGDDGSIKLQQNTKIIAGSTITAAKEIDVANGAKVFINAADPSTEDDPSTDENEEYNFTGIRLGANAVMSAGTRISTSLEYGVIDVANGAKVFINAADPSTEDDPSTDENEEYNFTGIKLGANAMITGSTITAAGDIDVGAQATMIAGSTITAAGEIIAETGAKVLVNTTDPSTQEKPFTGIMLGENAGMSAGTKISTLGEIDVAYGAKVFVNATDPSDSEKQFTGIMLGTNAVMNAGTKISTNETNGVIEVAYGAKVLVGATDPSTPEKSFSGIKLGANAMITGSTITAAGEIIAETGAKVFVNTTDPSTQEKPFTGIRLGENAFMSAGSRISTSMEGGIIDVANGAKVLVGADDPSREDDPSTTDEDETYNFTGIKLGANAMITGSTITAAGEIIAEDGAKVFVNAADNQGNNFTGIRLGDSALMSAGNMIMTSNTIEVLDGATMIAGSTISASGEIIAAGAHVRINADEDDAYGINLGDGAVLGASSSIHTSAGMNIKDGAQVLIGIDESSKPSDFTGIMIYNGTLYVNSAKVHSENGTIDVGYSSTVSVANGSIEVKNVKFTSYECSITLDAGSTLSVTDNVVSSGEYGNGKINLDLSKLGSTYKDDLYILVNGTIDDETIDIYVNEEKKDWADIKDGAVSYSGYNLVAITEEVETDDDVTKLYLMKANVSTLYVSGAYTGGDGTITADGHMIGYNAFRTAEDASGACNTSTETISFAAGNYGTLNVRNAYDPSHQENIVVLTNSDASETQTAVSISSLRMEYGQAVALNGVFETNTLINPGTITVEGTGTSLAATALMNNYAGETTKFEVKDNANVTISGNVTNSFGASITVTDAAFTANSGTFDNNGTFTVTNSTVSVGELTLKQGMTMDWQSSLSFTGFGESYTDKLTIDMTDYDYGSAGKKLLLLDSANGDWTEEQYKALLTGTEWKTENYTLVVENGDLYATKSFNVYVSQTQTGENYFATVAAAVAVSPNKITVLDGTFNEAASYFDNYAGVIQGNGDGAVSFGSKNVYAGKKYTVGSSYSAPLAAATNLTISCDRTNGLLNFVSGGGLCSLVNGDDTLFVEGDITLNINGGHYEYDVVGADKISNGYFFRNGDVNVNITDGAFTKNYGGGTFFSGSDQNLNSGHAKITGNVTTTISGGSFSQTSWIYGGSIASSKQNNSVQNQIEGNTVIVVNSNGNEIHLSNIVAGSHGKGSISGDAKLVFTGNGSNINISGELWGGCSGDYYTMTTDGDAIKRGSLSSAVSGNRILSFTGFENELNSTKIRGFSHVEFTGNSDVVLNNGGVYDLSEIENWTFENGSTLQGNFKNDFAGDTLNLNEFNSSGFYDLITDLVPDSNNIFNGLDSLGTVCLNNQEVGDLDWDEEESTLSWAGGSLSIVDGEIAGTKILRMQLA